MKRVIYVPSELDVERGEEISRTLNLPIQVGESTSTEGMDFNRKEIQILSVPSVKEADIPSTVYSQVTFPCNFTDDWSNFLKSKAVLKAKNEKNEYSCSPQFREIHFLRFGMRIWEPGEYTLSLTVDDKVVFEGGTTAL
jgi:hypothetical protein